MIREGWDMCGLEAWEALPVWEALSEPPLDKGSRVRSGSRSIRKDGLEGGSLSVGPYEAECKCGTVKIVGDRSVLYTEILCRFCAEPGSLSAVEQLDAERVAKGLRR